MKNLLALTTLLLLLAVGGFMLFERSGATPAGAAFVACMRGANPVSQSCLRTEIKNLLTSTSTESLMHYIVASTSPEAVRGQCHAIAHEIGQETFIRDHSLERTLAACTQECNSGCIHGAIAAEVASTFGEPYLGEEVEHADTAQLESIGEKYCDGSRALCHGIGHIARIATSSLSAALGLCDRVAGSSAQTSCYLGVFMEDNGRVAFVQHEPPAIGDDYGYPCSSLAARYLPACYEKLVDYRVIQFNANHVAVPERLDRMTGVCTKLAGAVRSQCFFGYGYGLSRLIGSESQQYDRAAECDRLSGRDQTACMRGLAYYYATFARSADAVTYCGSRTRDSQQCFDIAFEHMGMTVTEMSALCERTASASCTHALASFTERGLSPVFENGRD